MDGVAGEFETTGKVGGMRRMTPGFTIIDNDAVIGRLPEIPAAALKVYLALARRANKAGWCFPSIGTIQADTGLARKTTCDAIKDLVGLGLLAISAGPAGRGSHGYTLPAMATGSEIEPVSGSEIELDRFRN
jgi:hypothetical protein